MTRLTPLILTIALLGGCATGGGHLYLMEHPGMEKTDAAASQAVGSMQAWIADQFAQLRLKVLKARDVAATQAAKTAADVKAIKSHPSLDPDQGLIGVILLAAFTAFLHWIAGPKRKETDGQNSQLSA